MNRRGHRGKVDRNQAEIVAALRKFGCSVQSLAPVGDGCPDLLVGYAGKNLLIECKMPDADITEDQWRWRSQWNGNAVIATSAEAAVRLVREWLTL